MRSAAVIAHGAAPLHDRDMRLTPAIGSLAINAALLGLMGLLSARTAEVPPRAEIEISLLDVPSATVPALPIAVAAGGGGSPGGNEPRVEAAPIEPTHVEPTHIEPTHGEPTHVEPTSPWDDVDIRIDRSNDIRLPATEVGTGIGNGIGIGNGVGTGLGNGIGNGVGVGIGRDALRDIAALRVPIPSQARPAKLLHPTRETEVDDAELYAAIVTVDTDGDVVGARMTRSHPGSRGDTAASMIWQFRYSPALDDAGQPVRSTFEQHFAVR
jgi:hypothetical protein